MRPLPFTNGVLRQIFKVLPLMMVLLTSLCFGQKDLIGLFGECEGPSSSYMCQQVLFKDDNTFIFYDLLHLKGWTSSHGTWKKNGDTVTIKSFRPLYKIEYNGNSLSDSIVIFITDSTDVLDHAQITLKFKNISLDKSRTFKYPRQSLDSFFISCIGGYNGPITLDEQKLKYADTVQIELCSECHGKYYFDNEKWLLQNGKLFHVRNGDGTFDREKYYIKVKLTELKYHKDY